MRLRCTRAPPDSLSGYIRAAGVQRFGYLGPVRRLGSGAILEPWMAMRKGVCRSCTQPSRVDRRVPSIVGACGARRVVGSWLEPEPRRNATLRRSRTAAGRPRSEIDAGRRFSDVTTAPLGVQPPAVFSWGGSGRPRVERHLWCSRRLRIPPTGATPRGWGVEVGAARSSWRGCRHGRAAGWKKRGWRSR